LIEHWFDAAAAVPLRKLHAPAAWAEARR